MALRATGHQASCEKACHNLLQLNTRVERLTAKPCLWSFHSHSAAKEEAPRSKAEPDQRQAAASQVHEHR